ncbi:HAD family phosphatase [Candidatus Woesearchaeota archaeon]|nr:HAD family phosphatase [Candidatus Woesearchaeota archaeon]
MTLVVFDVDGVLLDVAEGGFILLAKAIGKEKEVAELHAEYEKRKDQGPWGLDQLASMFNGQNPQALLEHSRRICKNHIMPGAVETVDELRKRGYAIAFYSSNPIIVLEALKEIIPCDFMCGNGLEITKNVCTGRLSDKVDRYEKAKRLEQLIAQLMLKKDEVYIIGDSITDLPMAQNGRFISFNSHNAEVDASAEFVIKNKELREVLKYVA